MIESAEWLAGHPERPALSVWLAVNARGPFLLSLLAQLVRYGELTPAQETALRNCKRRAEQVALRAYPPASPAGKGVRAW